MTDALLNVISITPELVLLVGACASLLLGVFLKKDSQWIVLWMVYFSLVIAGAILLRLFFWPPMVTFDHLFVLDRLAIILKLFICGISLVAFLYSPYYLHDYHIPPVEYFVLGLLSVLGMMILVSSHSFLTLFLGLELFSLPVYAMVALQRNSVRCSEAAMKYFVIGTMATGMLLYGMSMIYGATRTLELPMVAAAVASTSAQNSLVLVFGLVFIVAGIAFKLGAAPFHMWVPDVYEGASSPVTLFISSAPKIAALGMAFRLLVDAMPTLVIDWQGILMALAVLSITLGNLAAIAQSNFKRMLAYSSIAHMGYMFLGLLTGTATGYAAALFYVITYAIISLRPFCFFFFFILL